jgi:hypothetical protein
MSELDPRAGRIPGCVLDAEGLEAQRARYARLAAYVSSVRRKPDELLIVFDQHLDRLLLDEALAAERDCCRSIELAFEPPSRRLRVRAIEPGGRAALDAISAALAADGRSDGRSRVRGVRARRGGVSRQIGPVGTASRIVLGAVAIALPIALSGFSWAEALVALVALPVIAAIAAALIAATLHRLVPGALERRHAICSAPACALIAVMVIANDGLVALIGGNGNVTLSVWLGASMPLAAAGGYADCEVLAPWNLITGRDDQVGCILYTPIDRAEAKRHTRVARP